jgi:hypothetical protein
MGRPQPMLQPMTRSVVPWALAPLRRTASLRRLRGDQAEAARGRAVKKRNIPAEASGTLPSVQEPLASPPEQSWPPRRSVQLSSQACPVAGRARHRRQRRRDVMRAAAGQAGVHVDGGVSIA